ncbi:MAG: hypothetical protein KF819_12730 [Labilithrix sp.]|nr:hypothetical protein [Labilithrix sp.]
MTRRLSAAIVFGCVASLAVACSAPADGPSEGKYTVRFPSTAAAVATDTVQLYFYAVPTKLADRNNFCQSLLQARKRGDNSIRPIGQNPPVNLCEMFKGVKPVVVGYGEKAVLGIGRRGADDFLVGCVIQTYGAGDAPLDLDLALVDVGLPVPTTDCTSVSQACEARCTRQ